MTIHGLKMIAIQEEDRRFARMRLFIGTKIKLVDLGVWPEHLLKLKLSFGKRETEIRWTPLENYHITLAFLGEQTEESISILKSIIDETVLQHSTIETEAHGMGAFPGLHNARVVWIGVQNKKSLRALQENLVGKLASKIFAPPEESFIPHVTVGRLRNLQSVKSFLDPHLRKSWGTLKISELTLFKSEVFGNYPKYTPLYSRTLAGHPVVHADDGESTEF